MMTEESAPEQMITLFELLLSYAMIFKREEDFFISLDLFKSAKALIGHISKNLDKVETKEKLVNALLSSKLVQIFSINLNLENVENLKERQKIAVEIVVMVVKL